MKHENVSECKYERMRLSDSKTLFYVERVLGLRDEQKCYVLRKSHECGSEPVPAFLL